MYLTEKIILSLLIILTLLTCRLRSDFTDEQELNLEGSCTSEECLMNEKEEKMKYYTERAMEYHAKHRLDPNEEMTEEDMKRIMTGFREETIDIETLTDVKDDNVKEIYQDLNAYIPTAEEYEFPELTVVEAEQVGEVVDVELEGGRICRRITRSVRPAVFEIPDFLTEDECDHIIESAIKAGLNISNLFGAEIKEELQDKKENSRISRISEQAWLRKDNVGADFWHSLQARVAKLTNLPLGLIQRGEPIQVVSYVSGGHYHAHVDSVDSSKPCCFQTRCGEKELTKDWDQCCRLCRFMTVLYYLNDPEEGGETAFPLADMPEDLVEEKFVNIGEQEWYNLSLYCYNSSLAVKPRKGTAIMWYNHFVDEQTGYLGKTDRMSHHGGCDLIKGTKWIANNWIAGSTYEDRFKPSLFYEP